jgi:small conductance mechanosensitive channel
VLLLWSLIPGWIRQLAALLEVDAAALMRTLLQLVLIWLLCYAAWRLVRLVARRIERAVDDGDDTTFTEREQRGHTISQLLRSVGRGGLLGVAVLLTLNAFIDIRPILAGAGILGLAISFGAQSLVKDVIAGFFFLMEGQFGMGDVIEVAGKTGLVERMTLRMVVLRDANGTVHMVPNGQITTVSNMTRKWSRAIVDVGVDYETDVDRAIGVFRDEALRFAADPEWQGKFDGEPEVVGVHGLDENAVTIRTLLRTHAGQQWAVAREFRRRIKNRLDRERIAIPFPQRTLRVRMETLDELGRRGGAAMPWAMPGQPPGRAPRDSHIIPPDSGHA